MTTSPYDSLPTGDIIDVDFQPAGDEMEQSAQRLVYREVSPAEPVESAKPIETSAPVEPARPVEPAKPAASALSTKPAESANPAVSALSTKLTEPSQPLQPAKTLPFDPPPRYSEFSFDNPGPAHAYILPFRETLLVPDALPDMDKLLLAEGSVCLTLPGKQSDKTHTYRKNDFLAGDITVTTIYQPAAGDCPVETISSTIPFSTDKCWDVPGPTPDTAPEAAESRFYVDVSLHTISAEPVNERKFIVTGEILIRLTRLCSRTLKLLQGSDHPQLIQAERAVSVTRLDHELFETTHISQDINIRDDQPVPVKILSQSIHIMENHRRITSGKLVINASVYSRILYLGEQDNEPELASLTNKTDFTQFLLVKDGIDPDLIHIAFPENNLTISIADKEDPTRFLLQGDVTTSVCVYNNKELSMVFDAYHRDRDISFETPSQELSCIKGTVTGELSVREVVHHAETDPLPAKLLWGTAQPSDIKAHCEKERIIIEGTVPVKLLALDEENEPFIIEASLPLRGALDADAKASGAEPVISAAPVIKDLWFDRLDSRRLEIDLTLWISIRLYGKEVWLTPENLAFVDTPQPFRRPTIALYITGREDTLWEIAKRYKGDAAAIAALNGLDPLDLHRPLTGSMKLLVTE